MWLLGVRLVEGLVEVKHLGVGDLTAYTLSVLFDSLVNLVLALAETCLGHAHVIVDIHGARQVVLHIDFLVLSLTLQFHQVGEKIRVVCQLVELLFKFSELDLVFFI